MSQVDWLVQYAPKLKPGEAAASIVTSGDIDSVYIHFLPCHSTCLELKITNF